MNFLGPMLFHTRERVQKTLRWLSAGGKAADERLAEQMLLAVKHFRLPKDGIYPTVFPDDELQQLRLPVLLLVGDHEVIYDPQLVVSRAKRTVPGVQAEIIPGAGHLLNMEQAQRVNKRIAEFLEYATH